jgi:hypothetical protein
VTTPRLDWTPLRVARLRSMWARGCPGSCIATMLFGSKYEALGVWSKRQRLGLPPHNDPKPFSERKWGRWSEREQQAAGYMFREGDEGTAEIATHLSRTRRALQQRLAYHGKECGTPNARSSVWRR